MRKIKYIPVNESYKRLTEGKVYDVTDYIEDIDDDYIQVVNDEGFKDYYYVYTNGISEFIDVTHEYRSEIIDEILM